MNEQLQAQITQILAQIMVSVGEIKDFSVSQLPDIAQQYITYGIWSTSFYAIICFLILLVCIFSGFKIVEYSKRDDGAIILMMFPVCIGLVVALGFFHNVHNLILVLTAPKVWFLLELKNMIK